MNIQEYMTPEVVVPALIMLGAALFVFGMIRYMVSSLAGKNPTCAEDLCEDCHKAPCDAKKDRWAETLRDACYGNESEKINIKVGKTYYSRMTDEDGSPVPFPQLKGAIKILAVRGDWVKYILLDGEDEGLEKFASTCWIDAYFMEDEFGDFAKPKFENIVKSEAKIEEPVNNFGFIPEDFIPKVDEKAEKIENSKTQEIEKFPEVLETSMNNVIQIDGHSYTLTPVK